MPCRSSDRARALSPEPHVPAEEESRCRAQKEGVRRVPGITRGPIADPTEERFASWLATIDQSQIPGKRSCNGCPTLESTPGAHGAIRSERSTPESGRSGDG